MDHQVPEAAINLKQGFGRLIRTKRYGQLFLDSLPDCTVVENQLVGQAPASVAA